MSTCRNYPFSPFPVPLSAFAFFLAFLTAPSITAQIPEHKGIKPGPLAQGDFLASGKRYKEALQFYKEAIERDPKNSYAFRGLVRSYKGTDQLHGGETFLNNYLTQHPNSSSALYGLGFLYYLKNDRRASEEFLLRSAAENPLNALALNNLGALYSLEKDFPKAITFTKKAIALKPSENMFFRNLHGIYFSSGSPDKFENEFQETLKSGSSDTAHGYGTTLARQFRQEGFRLYSQGKPREALYKFLKILDLYKKINYDPGVVTALFSIGVLYEELGEIEEAKNFYHKTLKRSPLHIQAQERLKNLTEGEILH